MPVQVPGNIENPPKTTSGLNYTGGIFNSWSSTLKTQTCDTALGAGVPVGSVMPDGGISTPNKLEGAAIAVYVSSKECTDPKMCVRGKIPGKINDMDKQLQLDRRFYETSQEEYCFYEVRYRKALTDLLTKLSSNTTVTTAEYNTVIGLNNRLNSLLLIVNEVADRRAGMVNQRSNLIERADNDLHTKNEQLRKQKEFLQSSDVRIRTQEEMMRYSAEKSRAMNIQIVFFVALNIVALGTILTVYKNLKPSV